MKLLIFQIFNSFIRLKPWYFTLIIWKTRVSFMRSIRLLAWVIWRWCLNYWDSRLRPRIFLVCWKFIQSFSRKWLFLFVRTVILNLLFIFYKIGLEVIWLWIIFVYDRQLLRCLVHFGMIIFIQIVFSEFISFYSWNFCYKVFNLAFIF